MLRVDKIQGGYIVSYDGVKQIATAENVANLIVRFWPDVMEHIQQQLAGHPAELPPP